MIDSLTSFINPGVQRGRVSQSSPDTSAILSDAAALRSNRQVAQDDVATRDEMTPQRILNKQILAALNQHLAADGQGPVENLKKDDFTPEAVADRILGFIGRAIGLAKVDGADENKINQMFGQARQGVEKGFEDARKILKDLGGLTGQVKDGVDKTYGLVQDGLKRLENGDSQQASGIGEEGAVLSSGYGNQNSLALEVRTREGDVVTINLQRNLSASSTEMGARSADGAVYMRSDKMSASFSLEYQIQGNLNDDEQAALKDLLGGVDKLADDFFAGGSADTLKKAMNLGYNDQQLAGFSLSLQQTETRSVTMAYQRVGRLAPATTDQTQTAAQPADQRHQGLAQLLRNLQGLINDSNQGLGTRLDDPSTLLKGLLSQRLGLDPRYAQAFGTENSPDSLTPDQLTTRLLGAANALGQLHHPGKNTAAG